VTHLPLDLAEAATHCGGRGTAHPVPPAHTAPPPHWAAR
jgi:hypothetical protein